MVETFWFWAVAVMLALYAVFDGFDLGTGIVHLYAARNDDERRVVLQTIGHVWDGNEVWLLAAGGTLYFALPTLYASSFSGFYLPLMIVLWLFMFRGVSLEFRHHLDNGLWRPFWDVTFAVSSALLTIFHGAALGNVLRGVPLDEQARFFLPLWTNFQVGPEPGILDGERRPALPVRPVPSVARKQTWRSVRAEWRPDHAEVRLRLHRGRPEPGRPVGRQGGEPGRDDPARAARPARVHHQHRRLPGVPGHR